WPERHRVSSGDYVVATVRRRGSSLYDQIGTYHMTTDEVYFERGVSRRHGYLTEYDVDDPEYIVKAPDGLRDISVIAEPLSVAARSSPQLRSDRPAESIGTRYVSTRETSLRETARVYGPFWPA